MYVVVGRFRFRPMSRDEWQRIVELWQQDFTPLARSRPGFRGVQFIQVSDDDVMTVWQWDSAADWEAAQAPFGSFLQQHVGPHLAGPPERFGGEVALHVLP